MIAFFNFKIFSYYNIIDKPSRQKKMGNQIIVSLNLVLFVFVFILLELLIGALKNSEKDRGRESLADIVGWV